MNINDRVRVVRKTLGLTQVEFGKRIAVAQGYMTSLESGYREITEKIFKLICAEFNINEEWLRTGKGDMFIPKPSDLISKLISDYKLNRDQASIIQVYLELDDVSRQRLVKFIKDAADKMDSYKQVITNSNQYVAEEEASYNVAYTTHIKGKVAGGAPIFANEEYCRTIRTHIKVDCALELIGDSMSPDFNEGDILLVRRNVDISDSDVVIVLILVGAEIAEATCKKFYRKNGSVILKSINTQYEDRIYSQDRILVYGKVVGKIDKDMVNN